MGERDPEKASKRGRSADTAIDYVHVDACELRLAEGELSVFLAVHRESRFVHAAFFGADTKTNGAAFLREAVEALASLPRCDHPAFDGLDGPRPVSQTVPIRTTIE